MAAAILALVFAADAAVAQVRLNPARAPRTEQRELTPATSRNPAGVRNHLLAIHGFTRNGLETASAGVPEILRGFIADPGESLTVKRQAIKALGLYPTDENFSFIRAGLAGAPLGLQRLYVRALMGFAPTKSDKIGPLLEGLLASPEVSLRHAAVGLAAKLAPSPALEAILRKRMQVESDATLRSRIQRVLKAKP